MAGWPQALEDRLEAVEKVLYEDLYRALPTPWAGSAGIECVEIDGALRFTCRVADHPFLNRVMGVPAGGLGWIDRLVEHYAAAGIRRWMVQIPPSTPARSAVRPDRRPPA